MKASLPVILLLLLPGGESPLDQAVTQIPMWGTDTFSPRCDDAEFLRRLSLDLLGYPPNAEQAEAFFVDPAPDKRESLVETCLASPRFADYWARRWAQVFFENYHEPSFDVSPGLKLESRRRLLTNFIGWLRTQIQEDRPWPAIVAEMITAKGNTATVPQLGYKLSFYGEERHEQNFGDRMPQQLLGIRFLCMRCHDHPYDRWIVEDFHGMAAFLSHQRATPTEVNGREEVDVDDEGVREWSVPGWNFKAEMISPSYFGQPGPRVGDRPAALAAFIAADKDKHLQEGFANRVWSWLVGRGVFEPVDDLTRNHRPVSKELLGELVRSTDQGKGSLKSLVRTICATDTYQRSSKAEKRCDRRHFCRAEILPLTGDQLINSVQVALRGAPGLDIAEAQELTAALTMRPQVGCEVRPLPCTTLHALMFRNSEKLWEWIRVSPVLKAIRRGAPTDDEVVGRLFLAVLSRNPSDTERSRFLGFIHDRGINGLQDACWTLINTAEFLTRH